MTGVGIGRLQLHCPFERLDGAGDVVALLFHQTQHVERRRVFRGQPARRLELASRLLVPPQVKKGAPLVVVGGCRARRQPRGLGKLRQGCLQIKSIGQRDSQVEVALGRGGFEGKDPSEAFDRLLLAAKLSLDHSQRRQGAGVIGRLAQRSLDLLFRLAQAALGRQHEAQVEIRLGILRVVLNSLTEKLLGQGMLPLLPVQGSQVVLGLGKLRVGIE